MPFLKLSDCINAEYIVQKHLDPYILLQLTILAFAAQILPYK